MGGKYKKQREQLCIAQDWKCFYCGCDLHDCRAVYEHVLPLKVIKSDNHPRHKAVAACSVCNRLKGTFDAWNETDAKNFVLERRLAFKLDKRVMCPDGVIRTIPNI